MERRDRLQDLDTAAWLELPDGSTRFGLLLTSLAAVACAVTLWNWQSSDPLRYRILLAAVAISSGPWIGAAKSRLSMLIAVLYGLARLSEVETVLIGAIGVVLNACWHYGLSRKGIEQILFKTAVVTLSIIAAEQVFHSPWLGEVGVDAVRFVFASVALFLIQTLPTAVLYALRDEEPLLFVWQDRHLALFPYYMASALLAQILALA